MHDCHQQYMRYLVEFTLEGDEEATGGSQVKEEKLKLLTETSKEEDKEEEPVSDEGLLNFVVA